MLGTMLLEIFGYENFHITISGVKKIKPTGLLIRLIRKDVIYQAAVSDRAS